MGVRESVVERPQLHRRSSYDRLIRLCVAGCAASTSVDPLINEFLGYGYRQSPKSNLKIDFRIHKIAVDGEIIKLQVWNLYGVRYFGLSPVIFRNPLVGLMLLYDVGEERSFERAKELISDAQQMNTQTTILLVGCHYYNKKEREVTYYMAREFADDRDIPVVEITCGKEGVNVEFAFMTLVAAVLSKRQM